MKPIIAVPGPHDTELLYHSVSVSTVSLHEAYASSIVRAGGIPLVIPPLENEEDLLRLVDLCDGILLPGGEDVDPVFYHEPPSPKLGRVTRRFDKAWITVVHYAVEKGIPLLGICRGMQLANVALGGTLYQDLSCYRKDHILHAQHQDRSYPIHRVHIDSDSCLANILGTTEVDTNTMHHQSVHRAGRGLKVTARTEDGVIEAMEDEHSPGMLLLVQWHPEELQDTVPCMRNLFTHLVEKAADFARTRG